MNDEHKQIIKEAIKDSFALKDKYSDYEIDHNFQLLLSQLDLFKTMATLIVAIIGIGYVFSNNFNDTFLFISGVFSLFVLLGTLSYTREIINSQAAQIIEVGKKFRKDIGETIDVSVESIKKGDSELYFNYARKKIQEEKEEGKQLIYADEIFTFLLYNSILFLILGFFADRYNINLISVQSVVVIFLSYIFSFKNWSSSLIKILSKKISHLRKSA